MRNSQVAKALMNKRMPPTIHSEVFSLRHNATGLGTNFDNYHLHHCSRLGEKVLPWKMCRASHCVYPCYYSSPVLVNLKQTFIHVFSIYTRVDFSLQLRKLWGGGRSRNGGSHAYLSSYALVLFCLEEVEQHLQKGGVFAVGLHHVTCTSHLLA